MYNDTLSTTFEIVAMSLGPDNQNVLYGGDVTDSLEKARSFGQYCYNRLKKFGDLVLFVRTFFFK